MPTFLFHHFSFSATRRDVAIIAAAPELRDIAITFVFLLFFHAITAQHADMLVFFSFVTSRRHSECRRSLSLIDGR